MTDRRLLKLRQLVEDLETEREVLLVIAGTSPARVKQPEFNTVALWWQEQQTGDSVELAWRFIQRVNECQPEIVTQFRKDWCL